jgi:hypothetical protein
MSTGNFIKMDMAGVRINDDFCIRVHTAGLVSTERDGY